jgi:hypothetical protein
MTDHLTRALEAFNAIASRDDAEAFAVVHGFSRALMDQAPAPQQGTIDGETARMSLRWFDEIVFVMNAPKGHEVTLEIGKGTTLRVGYRE